MPNVTSERELLHVKEAAALLDVHVCTIRRAIHDGQLEAVRLGPAGRFRVTREALDNYLTRATKEKR